MPERERPFSACLSNGVLTNQSQLEIEERQRHSSNAFTPQLRDCEFNSHSVIIIIAITTATGVIPVDPYAVKSAFQLL